MQETFYLLIIDPPGPCGRIGGHYFHTWCPSVRRQNKEHASMLKQNTLQGAWWVTVKSFVFYLKRAFQKIYLDKTGVINDPLGQHTVPAGSDSRLILKFWDGRTDNMCKNSDHFRPGLWSASWIKKVMSPRKQNRFFDPPGHGRIGGHYFHTWCPYVRPSVRPYVCPSEKQKHATTLT